MGIFRRKATAEQLEQLQGQVADLAERLRDAHAARALLEARLAEVEARTGELGAGHDLVRARVDEVGRAVGHQLDELNGELDGLGATLHGLRVEVNGLTTRLPEGALATTALVEELRGNQAAIANELVRYEIALREEVATLAARLPTRR
jgi:chromosome segregation ATPase